MGKLRQRLLGSEPASQCHYLGGINMTQYEREEKDLYMQYENGEISNVELNEALRELERDYRAAAEEAARDAYEAELHRW